MTEAKAAGGAGAPGPSLLEELITERKAELQILVDRIYDRGTRPNGTFIWKRGEAHMFHRIRRTIAELERRAREQSNPGR